MRDTIEGASSLVDIDPVCGMKVELERARARGNLVVHGGSTYLFCAKRCRETFEADPQRWSQAPTPNLLTLGRRPRSVEPSSCEPEPSAEGPSTTRRDHDATAAASTSRAGHDLPLGQASERPTVSASASGEDLRSAPHSCPMHPEVTSVGPGDCPECGMALEPQAPSAEPNESPELRSMRRRFLWSLPFTLPLTAVEMGGMLPGGERLVHALGTARGWLELALSVPVVFLCGAPLLTRGVQGFLRLKPNMFSLVTLGTLSAWAYSAFTTLAPRSVPSALRALSSHGPDLYFEAAAVIVTLVLLGQVLELKGRGATLLALRELLQSAPSKALRIGPGEALDEVLVEDVRPGDLLLVRPGDTVPVDGRVVEGESSVLEALVTGEPLPSYKAPGSSVTGGTVNGTSPLRMRAERVGADTLISRIVALVLDAQRTRAPIQRLADRASELLVPAVLVIALLTFGIWMVVGPEPRLPFALTTAVSVLIVACPCAIGLATPMAITVAMGRGAREGVLIKNGEALELLGRIDTLVFDKTGTLTQGRPTLTRVMPLTGFDEDEVLQAVASMEQYSEHPLASALVSGAVARGLTLSTPTEVLVRPGFGVQGQVGGRQVAVGNESFARELGVETDSVSGLLQRETERGHTAVAVYLGGQPAGVLTMADPVRPEAAEVLRQLREDGLTLRLLSGDQPLSVSRVAAELGLGVESWEGGVLPDQKEARIQALRAAGHRVGMAGDGINDAPALAAADVGIALGTGTELAISSAHVTLLRGELSSLVRARRLGRETLRNIRQNLWLALGYNLLGVPIAAGVLYPSMGLLLGPMLASAAMSLSSVSVIANALRLRRSPRVGAPLSTSPRAGA